MIKRRRLFNILEEEQQEYSENYNKYLSISGKYSFLVKFTLRAPSGTTNTLLYSINGGNWQTLANDTYITISGSNSYVSFKGECVPSLVYGNYGIGTFSILYDGEVSIDAENLQVFGNIMSLLYGDNFIEQTSLSGKTYVFEKLFTENTLLISAENLILPATTLSNYCYYGMFQDCTSLTTAPELPAKIIYASCYYRMFYNCSSLNYIKCLAIVGDPYNWTYGVAASGTFVCSSDTIIFKDPATRDPITGSSAIPSGWIMHDSITLEYHLSSTYYDLTTAYQTNVLITYIKDNNENTVTPSNVTISEIVETCNGSVLYTYNSGAIWASLNYEGDGTHETAIIIGDIVLAIAVYVGNNHEPC